MPEYEMIRKIFNQCSRNAQRDIFFSEVEADDPDDIAREYAQHGTFTRTDASDGTIHYDIECDGLVQSISLTQV